LFESRGRTYAKDKLQLQNVLPTGVQIGRTTYHKIHEPLKFVPDCNGNQVADVGNREDLARRLVPGADAVG
jgi:hypothetical protein